MLLQYDLNLYEQYQAMQQPSVEQAITSIAIHTTPTDVKAIMGATILPQQFLVSEEEAANYIFSEARKHWGRLPEALHDMLASQFIKVEVIHEALDDFFYTAQGKARFLAYLRQHQTMTLSQLLQLLFQRTIDLPMLSLQQIHLYPVANKYMVHFIYKEQNIFWYALLYKKIYSLFIHEPLATMPKITGMLKQLNLAKKISYAHVDNFTAIYSEQLKQLVAFIATYNPLSNALKQLELGVLFILAQHKVHNGEWIIKKIKALRLWNTSEHVLTKTEKVALRYVLLQVHATRKEFGKVISNAHYLLTDECLNNYAVKIMLTYEEVLPTFSPTTHTLIKRYDKNYMEQLYYYYFEALVALKKYQEALHVLKLDPLASTTLLFRIIHKEEDNKALDQWQSYQLPPLDVHIQQQSMHYINQMVKIFDSTTYKGLARRLKQLSDKVKETQIKKV